MKRRLSFVCLLVVAALTTTVSAEEPIEETRSLARQAFAEGRFEEAEHLFERAVLNLMEQGETAKAAAGLVDLGNVYEARGQYEDAKAHYLGALIHHLQDGSDLDLVTDLLSLAHVARLQGEEAEAAEYERMTGRVLSGQGANLLAVEQSPMNCGDSREITPQAADIPGGQFQMLACGSNEEDAVATALDSLFANIYMPTCAPTCWPLETCDPSVAVKRPVSTTPADYGSPQWEVKVKGNRTYIVKIKITKFPDGMKVVQSCSEAVCAQEIQ